METQLKLIFAQVLSIEPENIDEGTSQESLVTWDSLGHLNLVTAIEDTFNIRLTISEIMEMTDFKKVYMIVSRYKGES